MNVLFLNWESFGKEDILAALKKLGHTVELFFHKDYQERNSQEFDSYFDDLVRDASFDFCFSSNYYPVLSNACHRHQLPYLSWVYDSPLVSLYSYTVLNPCNHIYTFDREQAALFQSSGIKTVHYLPLAANTKRYRQLSCSNADLQKFQSDISFVGALYNEQHNLYDRLVKHLDSYTKGYLEGILQAQKKIYGYFFLEQVLSDSILASLKKALNYTPNSDGVETEAYIYANYFLCRKLTEMERISYLSALSEQFSVKLFTLLPSPMLPKVANMGTVNYLTQMPLVFFHSKINLNITLRSIHSGIPLRAMDIMGSHGFLLTNYQEDFLEYFEPDIDFVYFTEEAELLEKAGYYLSHDPIREKIAASGYQKMQEQHTYFLRIKAMIDDVFPL